MLAIPDAKQALTVITDCYYKSAFMLNQSHILYFLLDCFMKVGKTLSYGNGRFDDGKALAELGFEVKNFLLLACMYACFH